jgi:hypothetical protein
MRKLGPGGAQTGTDYKDLTTGNSKPEMRRHSLGSVHIIEMTNKQGTEK